jgi:hypothetical protein
MTYLGIDQHARQLAISPRDEGAGFKGRASNDARP